MTEDQPAPLPAFEPLELIPFADPRLHAPAAPVDFDGMDVDGRRALALLAGRMLATMYDNGGIGLAAPQVGAMVRVIVFDVGHTRGGGRDPEVMVNPEIGIRTGRAEWTEACLSQPGVSGRTVRSKTIKVSFLNLDGERQVRRLEMLEAAVVQHEVDHLNGINFTERAKDVTYPPGHPKAGG